MAIYRWESSKAAAAHRLATYGNVRICLYVTAQGGGCEPGNPPTPGVTRRCGGLGYHPDTRPTVWHINLGSGLHSITGPNDSEPPCRPTSPIRPPRREPDDPAPPSHRSWIVQWLFILLDTAHPVLRVGFPPHPVPLQHSKSITRPRPSSLVSHLGAVIRSNY